ncbi:EAL domain-containing protein [Photobacterium nomapromontoriensis]|uniref:EAL domain-containing protein n=1 Tax=Photobacterium nomapromontoriensis TaxID=2910237 RepID=UPI003D10FB70
MKILLIEDDSIQMVSLKIKIKRLGFEDILVASNGIEALELIKKNNVDLVFCDLQLPQMDGVSFLAQVAEYNCDLSIVILSGADEAVLTLIYNMCSLANFRFVDVIKKPYQQEDLEQVFEKLTLATEPKESQLDTLELTVDELKAGFEYGLFTNHYQPQFHFESGEMVGVEALVRFEHPLYGIIGPLHFLDTIEYLGMSKQLFDTVLENAISAISKLQIELQLSVNISKSNLEFAICDTVIEVCEKYQFPIHKLTLELTEHDVYNGTIHSLANLARLRMHGVGLSIDDFGTGYSSLAQLVQLPYTELKIDKSFIHDLATNYRHQQVTKSSLILAHSLGLNCVVEGVEDKATWEYIRHLGGDICQGYFTGKPMTAEALSEQYYQNCHSKIKDSHLFHGLHCLILDNETLSSKALKKQLLKNYNVFSVKSKKITGLSVDVINDYQINTIIINQDFLTQGTIDLCLKAIELGFCGKFIFLSEFITRCPDIVVSQLTNYKWVVKTKTLHDTVNKVVNAAIENENKYEIDSKVQECLSERELFVAGCLIKGLSNKQIANELDISQKTVSTYKTRVLKKCGVKSIIELLQFNRVDS